ncbi:MAG: hypothetical protein ACOYMH_03185 [Zwartia sp.]|jgi:hypothetical protein
MASNPQSGAQASAVPEAQTNLLTKMLFAGVVALLWVLLYGLNHWIFAITEVSSFISWVFLPAALRMLAIMACDWAGALGLFAGALVTHQTDPTGGFGDGLVLAFLSATGPMLAFWFCTKLLNLSKDLSGLTATQLLIFASTGALLNAVPHNIYFYLSGRMSSPIEGLVPMLVGDLVGTLLMLYTVSLALRFVSRRSANPRI